MKHKSYNLIVTEKNYEKRLDIFLSQLDKIRTRSRAAKLISLGLVSINEKSCKASTKLKLGDTINYLIPTEKVRKLEALDMPLDIIFEDKDIIILNKESGLVVHPSHGHSERSLVHALLHHTSDLSMGFNEERPGIVHRIDKDTSGLLVIAKNDRAHASLAQQFKNKTTERKYLAICFGIPKKESGTIQSHLDRHPKDRKKWASCSEEKGRLAITNYKLLSTYHKQLSLISLQLETGRTHQIRVHLSELGIPIIGDWTYANKRRLKNIASLHLRKSISSLNRFALHAKSLGFVHPSSGEKLVFDSPIPENLRIYFELFQTQE